MTRFLLDTGSAGDYIHRRRSVYERARAAIRAGDRIGIGLPVLAELWFGVENSSSRERNADKLRRVLPELIIWPLTEATAEEYGRVAAELRRIGRPIRPGCFALSGLINPWATANPGRCPGLFYAAPSGLRL